MKTQNRKGLIELCTLALLHKEDYYGYDLSIIISKLINIADGTIYPVLRKMKNEGLLKTYLTEGKGGPPRKYYSLTELGKDEYIKEKQSWKSLVNNINELMED
ncbi:PadR family transcriptional regulator [Candidatus Izimaplasma bacterium ZiA1]|uniref:PadR family transcriptional regulator n=1 Tax=Candidatus Izimoplasma sp. ZiA1 TaxID=2024899 RepID=UPI000BAA41EF|nr:PadR family transcriptional regulator [Candidatus Izimaplasma bacterium ZiA1]